MKGDITNIDVVWAKDLGYPRLSDISMLSAMRGTRGGDNADMEGKSLHLT